MIFAEVTALGRSDVGISINSLVRELNALQQSAEASRFLIQKGLGALDEADSEAGKCHTVFFWSCPANTSGEQGQRDDIRAHLNYYDLSDDSQLNSGFYDIRDWAIRAFVAYNAVAEANSSMKQNAELFFADVRDNAVSLPRKIIESALSFVSDIVGDTVAGAVKGVFSNWITTVLIVGAAVGAGVIIYKKRQQVSKLTS